MPEISQEELDLLNRYKEIGEPDAINTELSAKAELDAKAKLDAVASASGFKASVLAKLSDGLEMEVKDGVAYVGDKTIEEYANDNWQDFLPSLKEEKVTNGVTFVKQASKSSAVNKLDNNVGSYLLSIYGSSKEQTVN